MTIEEVYCILETEKFNSTFNRISLYHKVLLLKMRKTFSEYFFIPENKIYKSPTYISFFSKILINKEILDIEKIKIDIYNKIPDLTLSVKYLEPPEVIKEIKDNMDNDIKILKNRIYTLKEISVVFNVTNAVVSVNKVLSKIAVNKNVKRNSIKFWLGDTISKNLNDIAKQTPKGNNINNNLKTIFDLSKKIDIPYEVIKDRMKKGDNVFGVNLSYMQHDKNKKDTFYYIKEEDFNKIISNKKYYIKTSDIKKDLKVLGSLLSVLINYYNFIYKKHTRLYHMFIKKETVIKLKEIIDLHNNNTREYINKLYDFIKKEKNSSFKLNFICGIIPILRFSNKICYNKRIEESGIDIKDGLISKSDTLKLLDYLNTLNIKKRKSKQQGETDG